MSGSVLFYVQHLLGIGHLRRALRIVEALSRHGVAVSLVSGGEPLPILEYGFAREVIQLPPIRARGADFKELVDTAGRPVDAELRGVRRTALLAAFGAAQPDAVLIEAFPFSRRAFRFELDSLVEAAWSRQPRPLVLCSLRDIVVVYNDAERYREVVDLVRAGFDYVLVHGDPAFIPLDASFPAASEISDRLIYTGYIGGPNTLGGVAAVPSRDETVGIDEVVVSVGGGAVGGVLLSTAIESHRQGCLAELTWRFLAGPNLPELEFRGLSECLPERSVLERFRPDFPQILRRCRVSVSQAGYNTILDVLAARAAAVVVPFAAERETEQGLRAQQLATRGVFELLHEHELSPERLAHAIGRAITRPPAPIMIATDGARRTAALVADMIRSQKNASACSGVDLALRPTDAMIGS
jgi:predicted glycosyltransferase